MALNIKNAEVERLAAELASSTGESKTEVIRQALLARRRQLAYRLADRRTVAGLQDFLSREIWSKVPERELGRRLSRDDEDAILGYGDGGA